MAWTNWLGEDAYGRRENAYGYVQQVTQLGKERTCLVPCLITCGKKDFKALLETCGRWNNSQQRMKGNYAKFWNV